MLDDREQHFLVRPNYPLAENLGRLLSSLMLLLITTVFLVAVCISNLLWLTVQTLMKLAGLLKRIAVWVWNVLCTLCRWADVVKVITSPFKKLQNSVWRKDGDSVPDSTLAYLEMPGELKQNAKYLRGIHTEEQFESVRKQL